MSTQIGKWGNSLAIRIPAALAGQFGLKEGSTAEMVAGEGGILIRKVGYALDELLEEVTPENLHSEVISRPLRRGGAG
ncbi:MAG: AbrB/MazE/SpoVT family DNA-binding domain-containing protein [Nitrospinota bacterium]|nr:AbrB/MazE/SpoVT family DNA-binding domain-containing protein [Nitrospinota bacterium]